MKKKVIKAAEADKVKAEVSPKKRTVAEMRDKLYGKKEGK